MLAAHWTFDGPADRHVVYQYNDDRGAAPGSADVDTVQTRKTTYLGLTVGAGGRVAETRSFYNVQGRLWLTWVDETGIGLPTHIDGYEYDDAGIRVKSGPIVLVGDMDMSLVIDGFDVDDFEFALATPGEYETDYGVDPDIVGDVDGSGSLNAFDADDFEDLLASGDERWVWTPQVKTFINDALNPSGYSQVNESASFDQLGPVLKQIPATLLWGGWKVLLDNRNSL